MGEGLVILLFLLLLAFYFLPTIVCEIRNAQHCWAIFLINLLLGWTVLGWFGAFIWAIVETPAVPKAIESDGTLTIYERKQMEKVRRDEEARTIKDNEDSRWDIPPK